MTQTQTKTSPAFDLDTISGDLELTTRAIDYIYSRLAEITERNIDQISKDNRAWELALIYKEAQELSLMLGDYVQRLNLEQRAVDSKVAELLEGYKVEEK